MQEAMAAVAEAAGRVESTLSILNQVQVSLCLLCSCLRIGSLSRSGLSLGPDRCRLSSAVNWWTWSHC